MYFLRAPLVWLRWFIWDMHYNMVYDFIINTPSIAIFPGVSIGGFSGKELSDICAIQSVTTPASFWVKNPDQCLDNIHKMVNGYAILFWWPFWLFLAWRLFWYGLARSCERPGIVFASLLLSLFSGARGCTAGRPGRSFPECAQSRC